MATSKGRSSQLSGVWVCRTLTLIAGLPAWNAGSLGRSHRMAKVAGAITRSDQPFGLRATSSAASHPHRALPAGPTGAASPPCSRTWPRSRRSPPIASHSRQHDPTPAERPAPATLLNTDPVVPDAPSLHPLKSWSLRKTRRGSVEQSEHDVLVAARAQQVRLVIGLLVFEAYGCRAITRRQI